MAAERARFVGAIVAMVVADTPAAARDAAERVVVDWGPLPAGTGGPAATSPDAPIIWAEAKSNVCVVTKAGDPAAVERAFARAAHVVTFETWVHRVTGVPMEPGAAVGGWGAAGGAH